MRHCTLVVEFLLLISLAFSIEAYDPSPLQDFCVATDDTKSSVHVNGEFCKDPERTTADDFLYQGLNIPADTSNKIGVNAALLTPKELRGLNTGGVTVSRIDYARNGVNPPHYHPRATEVIMVMKGTLIAGFITSNPEHRQFAKVLKPGDVFVFPLGLVHYQYNIGKNKALAFSGFSSQNPGVVTIANTVFGAKPPLPIDALSKSFQLDPKIIQRLQSNTWVNP